MMLAEAVNDTTDGPLADFTMSDKDRYELKIAGLLHDCGKVTTPVHVVDKATKLQTIYDRIHTVDTRFEVVKRDAEIEALKAILAGEQKADVEVALAAKLRQIDADRDFLRRSNVGGEAMQPEDQERVRRISREYLVRSRRSAGQAGRLPLGRRTREPHHPRRHADAGRREIINYHIVATIKMLCPAVAETPQERAGVRRRPSRTHGRQGLPEGP